MNALGTRGSQCPSFQLSLTEKIRVGNMADSVLLHSPDVNSPTNEQQLGYFYTPELTGVVSDLVNEVEAELVARKQELRFMNDWVHKRSNGLPYKWMKRWMVIREGFLMYSDRQIVCNYTFVFESLLHLYI